MACSHLPANGETSADWPFAIAMGQQMAGAIALTICLAQIDQPKDQRMGCAPVRSATDSCWCQRHKALATAEKSGYPKTKIKGIA